MNALDASALIALLRREEGADEAGAWLEGGLVSTVNLAEVLQKAVHRGEDAEVVHTLVREAGIGIVAFDDRMAIDSAQLWPLTRHRGLSLGDRSCLALARAVHGVAVTADRTWAGLDLPGIDVHVIER